MSLARLAFLVLLSTPFLAGCLGAGHSVNVYGGTRSLDTDDLGSLDDQTVYGGDVVLKVDLPFLAVEGGWLRAEDDAGSTAGFTDPEFATDEYFVGLRVVPWDFLIAPYASIGASFVDADLDADGASDTDGSLAYYVRVGAAWEIAFFRIGLDGRWLLGSDVDLDTDPAIDTDIDNLQITAFVGVGF